MANLSTNPLRSSLLSFLSFKNLFDLSGSFILVLTIQDNFVMCCYVAYYNQMKKGDKRFE